jgi:magnesium chelatase subunit D
MNKDPKSQPVNSATRAAYPFSAVVGQDAMKLALILNVIDPAVGGILLLGHRGTGKSTVVRALADLLPPISVVTGCPYRCDPLDPANLCAACTEKEGLTEKRNRQQRAVQVVELPLGATEDRVCGAIDIEQALASGVRRFEPGLLARANRGFLYIDEVNLLEDHLVDLLLDVAVTGINKVERESISLEHPARFVLIGSGNPEEGELRPQLLDRFGLYVAVTTEDDLDQRVEIVERREAFDRDRDAFTLNFASEQDRLRRQITRARRTLAAVKVGRAMLRDIARLCSSLKIDGHRGELTVTRAARALAAFEKRRQVTEADVRRVAVMALRHRVRGEPLAEAGSAEQIQEALDQAFAQAPDDSRNGDDPGHDQGKSSVSSPSSETRTSGQPRLVEPSQVATPNGSMGGEVNKEAPAASLPAEKFPPIKTDRRKTAEPTPNGPDAANGRRQSGLRTAVYDPARGRYARSVSSSDRAGRSRVALDATLRAWLSLAPPASLKTPGSARQITPVSSAALRFKLFKRKPGRLFIFALDLSGSMALNRIAQAKGLMLGLLQQSYVQRDHVAMVAFRGSSATLVLPPTRSMLRARRVLDALGVGGGTPLSAALACSLALARQVKGRHGELSLLLFTDGHANVPLKETLNSERSQRRRQIEGEVTLLGSALAQAGVHTVLIDTQNRFSANDEARDLAHNLGATYQVLATDVAKTARGWQL